MSVRGVASSVVAFFLVLFASTTARAHKAGLSRGDYRLIGDHLAAEIVLEKSEIAELVPGADGDGSGSLDAKEIAASKAALEEAIVRRIEVDGDGARCPGKLDDTGPVEGDGVRIAATYACASRPHRVTVSLRLFDRLAFGHRHLASLAVGGPAVDDVLYASHPSIAADVGPESGAPPPKSDPAKEPPRGVAGLFVLGIEHILTGYDHLLFLFGLVLVGGKLRSLVAVITAFTLAHSITLGLAALGVWAPSPRVVEPAIALSIAYVGAENFFVHDAHKRWRITFPFGLVHGFGFAGALQELDLPRAKIPLALLLFNGGVEAGQLAVLAVVLPILILLRQKEWFLRWGIRALSGAIVVAGLVWFVQRLGG